MRVLVFGGGGFIGSGIVERLLAESHQVTVFEKSGVPHLNGPLASARLTWIHGDILSMEQVGAAIRGVDAVVHLVSTTLPKSSNENPIYDVQSNVVGTLHILNAMVQHEVPRILFISSGGTVYGNPVYLPIDEKHPTEPHVSYGVTKLAIEKYLGIYERLHGIVAMVLRVANPYGERQRVETAQGAVGVFLERALRGLPIEIWGDGSVIRDFIYIRDVAEAFAKALVYEGEERVFNVSSGLGTSLNELVKVIERALGRPVELQHRPGRAFDIPVSVLSNALARREFGWEPRVGLAEGISRTIDWFRGAM